MHRCGSTLLAAAWLVAATLGAAAPPTNEMTVSDDAALAIAIGPGSGPWHIASGKFIVSHQDHQPDALTAQQGPAVLVSTQPHEGTRSLRALVRLRTTTPPTAAVTMTLGATTDAKRGVAMTLSATQGGDTVTCTPHVGGELLYDLPAVAKTLNWGTDYCYNDFAYKLHAYTQFLPGWPEDFRSRIEADMGTIPALADKWLSVRIDAKPGGVWFWVDDRLVGFKEDAAINPAGIDRIDVGAGAQVAGLQEQPFVQTPGYLPIPLQGYTNARALLDGAGVADGSLPNADITKLIDGVPFRFPGADADGNDHLDISRSLFRDANTEGYATHYPGTCHRDPARLQIRLPNGKYDALYLIAAADGRPDSIPLVTATFYRPGGWDWGAGYPESFAANVPLATASSSDAKRLPVTLSNGKHANLWLVKIPLDPGKLSAFADMDVIELELTKQLQQFRLYPDPANYGFEPGGLPSSVQVYAATLGAAPVSFTIEPDHFGHVWTAPAIPSYNVTLINRTDEDQDGKLTLTTRSYDGTEEPHQKQSVHVPRGQTLQLKIQVPVKLNGYHDVTATLKIAGRTWAEKRSLVRLAPDTRSPRWTEGKGALFGSWSYRSGHYSPNYDLSRRLSIEAGSRTALTSAFYKNNALTDPLVLAHWTRIEGTTFGLAQPWAAQANPDPKLWAAYQKEVLDALAGFDNDTSAPYRADAMAIFAESVISNRLTNGNFPEYWHGKPLELTPEEQEALRSRLGTAKCIAEAVRRGRPDLKILIEWGDPLFVVPLLRAGFPKELVDGTALDSPDFERLPEMQLHHVVLHRLYELKKEFAKAGIPNPALYYYEGPFFPTEPGALTWREQMDLQDRFALISMAYGVQRFYSGWYDFDSCDWYGAEHYGGCGIFRRIPYCDPKPAYAAFATMTDRLNEANYQDWVKTGSLTSYCLHFDGPRGNIYTLWTLRGQRTITLTLDKDATVELTDTMNNTRLLKSRDMKVNVPTSPTVLYVTTGGAHIVAAQVGKPDNADAQPADNAIQVANLGDGSWSINPQPNPTFEKNTFAVEPYPGRFSTAIVKDSDHGKVLASKLGPQEAVHELMPWYTTLVPAKPIVLKGAPSHIALWVKGASDWGRVIYVLRDAQGERWISIGTKDQWNCDDMHSWSSFNFDGWRYVRFEMPGHLGWDNFRRLGTTWWGHYPPAPGSAPAPAPALASGSNPGADDGIVDLPLSLEGIIIEQRSHVLYVNDVQPAASDTVLLGKLYLEYQRPEDAEDGAIRESRLRMPPVAPESAKSLSNPIADLGQTGIGAATQITRLQPPEVNPDGTVVRVFFTSAPGAAKHFIWVSAHADGRGAINMTPAGATSGQVVDGLRPQLKLYFWVTYADSQGHMSKPSPVHEEVLVDSFKER